MQKNIFQIALAGLVNDPGLLRGWEVNLTNSLGELPDGYNEIIELASKLGAGASGSTGNIDKLQSIFDSVSLSDERIPETDFHYYSQMPLSLDVKEIFPEEQQSNSGKKSDLTYLVDEIKQALPQNFEEKEGFLEEVLSILHRTAANVPSSVLPDVSLYDHQRMTSALGVCLLEKKSEDLKTYLAAIDSSEADHNQNTPLNEPIALLIGGDISGIQDFIYTITARGAARTLRGRSFYLQLLTEAVLRFVLRELELPYTNVIYSGGGHFFLLAPLSRSGKLEKIQNQISATLLKHHGTSLYFALGSAIVPLGGFMGGRFPEFWGEMHRSLAQKKLRRFSELSSGTYDQVFSVKEFGGNPESDCAACGEDHRKIREWEEEENKICSLCSSFEDLGKNLPKSDFVALAIGPRRTAQKETALEILAEFGLTVQFVESVQEPVRMETDQVVLWALSDPAEGKWPQANGAARWLRYTANRVSQYSFDELQDRVQGGFERLGVLRMDVDSLGELFKHGLGKQATITRLATLSFRTSLFFEGWLKQLCEQGKRKGLIYTVYAGGDDVFLLGPWDLIPDLARDIVRDFSIYTGSNPDVHLSAGMAFIHRKYPIYQAAEDAKDAIDQAKSLPQKNSFTFLGRTWQWVTFDKLAQKQKRLEDLVMFKDASGTVAPQSILQTLQELADEDDKHTKIKGRHVWGRWIWLGMYQLARLQERHREFADEIKSISDEIKSRNYLEIDQWGAAARWTEISTRKRKEQQRTL